MMRITETAIGLFDLAEAEARLFRDRLLQTAVTLLVMMAAMLVGVFAIALLMLAFYQTLSVALGTPGALAMTGLLSLILTAGLIWLSLWLRQKR